MHKIGRLDPGETDGWLRADAQAFGQMMPAGIAALIERDMTHERALVNRDEGEIVGTAASEPSVMTLPGLGRASVAVVVGVSVIPTHRRQGRLQALMRAQLDDLCDRGEPLATLHASEGSIYERFGYGVATFGARYVLDRRLARLRKHELGGGRVHFVDRETAAGAFRAVYAAYAPTRAGEVDRTEIDFAEPVGLAGDDDLKSHFHAVYEEDGRIDGYVAYNVAPLNAGQRHPRGVTVLELCSLTRAAYVALWEFLLGIDLVEEIRLPGRPIDEPIRWLLENPRQLRTIQVVDRTWLRLVDAVPALRARRYPAAGSLVLGIHDAFCPWNSGTVRIEVGEAWGQGAVEQVSSVLGEVDLELDASVLASLYLGGVPASQFAEAGRIVGDAAAVGLADRMFANDRSPFSSTQF